MDEPYIPLEELFPYEYKVLYPKGDAAVYRDHLSGRGNSAVTHFYDRGLWFYFPPFIGY